MIKQSKAKQSKAKQSKAKQSSAAKQKKDFKQVYEKKSSEIIKYL